MINYSIWCFCSFFCFLHFSVLDNKCHKQKWHMLFLAHMKLVVVCAHAITHINWRRLNSMVKSKADAKTKKSRTEGDFHYSRNINCCKWYKNKTVLLLATNAHGMSVVSNIMRQTKASATKTPASCPKGLFTYYVSTSDANIRFFINPTSPPTPPLPPPPSSHVKKEKKYSL